MNKINKVTKRVNIEIKIKVQYCNLNCDYCDFLNDGTFMCRLYRELLTRDIMNGFVYRCPECVRQFGYGEEE